MTTHLCLRNYARGNNVPNVTAGRASSIAQGHGGWSLEVRSWVTSSSRNIKIVSVYAFRSRVPASPPLDALAMLRDAISITRRGRASREFRDVSCEHRTRRGGAHAQLAFVLSGLRLRLVLTLVIKPSVFRTGPGAPAGHGTGETRHAAPCDSDKIPITIHPSGNSPLVYRTV